MLQRVRSAACSVGRIRHLRAGSSDGVVPAWHARCQTGRSFEAPSSAESESTEQSELPPTRPTTGRAWLTSTLGGLSQVAPRPGPLPRVSKRGAAQRAEVERVARPGPTRTMLGLLAREDERERLVRLLAQGRWVLLPGPAGSGGEEGRAVGRGQRQYTGTTGKIDNCRLGVLLAYASVAGRALIDREPYLPNSWTEDAERRADARIGQDRRVCHQARPGQGDAAAGGGGRGAVSLGVRGRGLRRQPRPQVLADRPTPGVCAGHRLQTPTRAARTKRPPPGSHPVRGRLGDPLGRRRRTRAARVCLGPGLVAGPRGRRRLLHRAADPPPPSYRRAGVLPGARPAGHAVGGDRTAGSRWAVEECFQAAKSEAGPDHCQARHYRAWYRHITRPRGRRPPDALRVSTCQKGEAATI